MRGMFPAKHGAAGPPRFSTKRKDWPRDPEAVVPVNCVPSGTRPCGWGRRVDEPTVSGTLRRSRRRPGWRCGDTEQAMPDVRRTEHPPLASRPRQTITELISNRASENPPDGDAGEGSRGVGKDHAGRDDSRWTVPEESSQIRSFSATAGIAQEPWCRVGTSAQV